MKSKKVNPSAASKETTPRHRGLNLVIGSEAFNAKHLDAQIAALEALFFCGDFFHFINAHTRDHLRRARLVLSTLLLHDYNVSPQILTTISDCVKRRIIKPLAELEQLTNTLSDYADLVAARKALGAIPVTEDASNDPRLSPIADFNAVKQLHHSRALLDNFDLFQDGTKKLDEKLAKALKRLRRAKLSPEQLHFEQLVAEYKLKQQAIKPLPARPKYLQYLMVPCSEPPVSRAS